jgi:hypothetical protein
MPNIPDDVFTEPDVSPDTLANLGPLRRLAGVWESAQGVDINPKADGPERRVFREHIRMEPIDAQTNGPQLLYGTFNGNDTWTYVTRIDLAVRGRTPPFNHRDTNTLRRIAPPTPNPLVGLLKSSKAG